MRKACADSGRGHCDGEQAVLARFAMARGISPDCAGLLQVFNKCNAQCRILMVLYKQT